IPWELYLSDERTGYALQTRDERSISSNSLRIHVTCKHSRLYHSDAIAERLQSAIISHFTLNTPHSPFQGLYVTLIDDRCTIWLDLAGEELYKRGHERFVNEAPLKETIASGMILEAISISSSESSNISHSTLHTPHPTSHITLIDPMSGSGTFSLEAAYMANGLIPGKCRDFALKHQPAFKPATWNHIVKQERVILSETPNGVESKNLIARILTSDISPKAVEIIEHNVECCPLANIEYKPINPQLRDFFSYTAPEIAELCGESSPVIVLNPPYGKRLDFDAPKLYTQIGRRLAELSRDLAPLGKPLTVAILAPKDDNCPDSAYTCTANLLRECPGLSPDHNPAAKCIATSHGGFSLNVFIAKIE
ncbi:MAG: RNA methyltransferase, partial [Fibrobacter sp.]|nr:RNA methyltransferase [Fibrobacter sp.]